MKKIVFDGRMNYFIKSSRFLTVLCLMILISSCSDTVEDETKITVFTPESELLVRSMETSLFEIADEIYTDYELSEICACDCNTASIVQSEINENYPFYISNEFTPLEYNCEDYFNNFGQTCGKSLEHNLLLSKEVFSQLKSVDMINSDEEIILNELLFDLTENVQIDISQYIRRIDNLDLRNSPKMGMVSFLIASSIESARDYYVLNGTLFDDPDNPNDPDDPQPIINKIIGGGIGGGWAILTAVWTGNDDWEDFGDYATDVGLGVLGGVIGAG